jgi:alanyl-tRNA synthetase
MSKSAAEIRQMYLDFFKEKSHKIIPSAPIVVKNDPTLMFTNAGMNQFKDYFLGNKSPESTRIADTQKCLRVSGKHNDLEEVGVDTYHHTMFEMLGNWSFGDYFKKETIQWAWELLTEHYQIPEDKLYVTIFEGDPKESLERDTESYDLWKSLVAEDRIINGNKKDNFWEMGDTGPCGPCTEIHVDCRPDDERANINGKDLVNKDHPQVIEIWNNVFIQFNRKADGSLEELPAKHVDTGMGFERLVRVLQHKTSNYDTDVFMPTIHLVENISGLQYGFSDSKQDIAFRVIADHIRAIAFSISDGQIPSNNGAGYVIRRILRRAVRYGYSYLNLHEPFLCKLLPAIANQFKEVFPELKMQEDFVMKVIKEEEWSFFRTLSSGIKKMDELVKELEAKKSTVIDGRQVFELFDTYGFPLDLTKLIAQENHLTIDEQAFEHALNEQKERSRSAAKVENEDWVVVSAGHAVEFVGYDQLEAEIHITRYRKVTSKGKSYYQLVFDKTPFYAESGGQVGDNGVIENIHERIDIWDTKKENDLIIHLVNELPERIHQPFVAKVDAEKRQAIMRNHSATHLLHAALRKILGTHVEQKGSLVNESYLRFDFSHFAKVTDEEIAAIERMVNAKILENIQKQEDRNIQIEEAKSKGAMALFGEKYGDKVRMITFDPAYSIELCGGTHVASTGNIGLVKIVSEGSISAGIRRIEALTGLEASRYLGEKEALLTEIHAALKNPKDILKSLEALQEENNKLKKQIEKFQKIQADSIVSSLLPKFEVENGISYLSAMIEVEDGELVKEIAQQLKSKVENSYILLGYKTADKGMIAVALHENIVKMGKYHAGNIVKELAKELNGGGGGQPGFATAGGTNKEGLTKILSQKHL